MCRKYFFITLIILLSFVLRFLWLDKVPNAIGGDELSYIVTAKAMTINGTDITGKWNPLSIFIFQYPQGEHQAEIPYFLLYPFSFGSLSLFSIKTIYALMSIFSVLLIYLVTRKLLDNKTAIIAGLIFCINPWQVFIGRTNYEMVPALFFFLVSFYILLVAKNWKILWSIPSLFLVFYSYIAVKLIFIPLVLFILIYLYFKNNKKFLKQYLIVFIFCFVLVLFFCINLLLSPGESRTSEIINLGDPEIARQVDQVRKNSIQTPLTNILENKFTVLSKIMAVKFINIFSFDYLFISSDQFVGFENHGLFYYIDLPFLILGIVFLASKNKKLTFLILGFIFIGALPHLFHKVRIDNFTPHNFLIFPFLIMFIAFGLGEFINLFNNKKLKYLSAFLITIIYLISVFSFLNTYFFQYSLKGNFDFYIRIASKYIKLANRNDQKIIVYSTRSYDLFKKYLFYSGIYSRDTFNQVKEAVSAKKYVIGNVEFVSCDRTIDFSSKKHVAIYDQECGSLKKDSPYIIISGLLDGGGRYKIYNDSICKKYYLNYYPSGLLINDFDVENLSEEKFCRTFITSRPE